MKESKQEKRIKLEASRFIVKANAEQREAIRQSHYDMLERGRPRLERIKQWKRANNAKMLETFLREGGEIRRCLTKITNK